MFLSFYYEVFYQIFSIWHELTDLSYFTDLVRTCVHILIMNFSHVRARWLRSWSKQRIRGASNYIREISSHVEYARSSAPCQFRRFRDPKPPGSKESPFFLTPRLSAREGNREDTCIFTCPICSTVLLMWVTPTDVIYIPDLVRCRCWLLFHLYRYTLRSSSGSIWSLEVWARGGGGSRCKWDGGGDAYMYIYRLHKDCLEENYVCGSTM